MLIWEIHLLVGVVWALYELYLLQIVWPYYNNVLTVQLDANTNDRTNAKYVWKENTV